MLQVKSIGDVFLLVCTRMQVDARKVEQEWLKGTAELYDAGAVCKAGTFCVELMGGSCTTGMPANKILGLCYTVSCLWDVMISTSFIHTSSFLDNVCNVLLRADIWKVSSMITGDSSEVFLLQDLFPQKHSPLNDHPYRCAWSHLALCGYWSQCLR